MTVLLAEDHAINRRVIELMLDPDLVDLESVENGEQAVERSAARDYDLILMDMRMPGLSGLQTTERARILGVRTPVVALTANAFEEDRHACLAAGMDDFLVKPLSPDALRRALAKWTGRGDWTGKAERAKVR